MEGEDTIVYPYIPNSVPRVKKQMLQEVDAENIEQLLRRFQKDSGLSAA